MLRATFSTAESFPRFHSTIVEKLPARGTGKPHAYANRKNCRNLTFHKTEVFHSGKLFPAFSFPQRALLPPLLDPFQKPHGNAEFQRIAKARFFGFPPRWGKIVETFLREKRPGKRSFLLCRAAFDRFPGTYASALNVLNASIASCVLAALASSVAVLL